MYEIVIAAGFSFYGVRGPLTTQCPTTSIIDNILLLVFYFFSFSFLYIPIWLEIADAKASSRINQ